MKKVKNKTHMTTLANIISKLDKTNPKLKISPSWDELCNIFQFSSHNIWHKKDDRLTAFFIRTWYCTDTWVGTRVYFLDDVLVCVSNQEGRKCDEEFYFIDDASFHKLRDYLYELTKEDPEYSINKIDITMEIPNTYKISYNSQIIHNDAIYMGNKVKIIKKELTKDIRDKKYDYFHDVLIELEDKTTKVVNCQELDFEYNTI